MEMKIGEEWLAQAIDAMTWSVEHLTPVEFNESHRYLPASVTSIPGPLSYDVNPFMREIVDCFDVNSPVREVNLKKGVQITYSTVLESGALYYMAHVKTAPIMYMTADKELAKARIENNFIPMLSHSGFSDIIRSSDEGNSKKTGKTANHIQFAGGGYLVPFGAKNADKMRSFSIRVLLKDEIDAWLDSVGKDGDPDKLSDDRCSGYWQDRKIFRGSTPLIEGTSKIQKAYLRGDQRKYFVPCKHCGHYQPLRWSTRNEDGVEGGIKWGYREDGALDLDSVCYKCSECGGEHKEHDKDLMLRGGEWRPTATPAEPGIRSYHLPALYSPVGMQPWSKCVSDYLSAYDPVEKRIIDIEKYQVFYNNILAEPFKVRGSKLKFSQVSQLRCFEYKRNQINQGFALEATGSRVLFLTCTVDVQKSYLAVGIFGWAEDMRSFLIDYRHLEADDATLESDKSWAELSKIIEEEAWVDTEGSEYRVLVTLIDSGYANATVVDFCSMYTGFVYPIVGRDRPSRNQGIKEFGRFTTTLGTEGYRITVDHYKDRLGSVLKRDWDRENGVQPRYTWNAPYDITDKKLKELTVESRKTKTDSRGRTTYYWDRPSGVKNELWDLTVYAHAAVEIFASLVCMESFDLETVVWSEFWGWAKENPEYLACVDTHGRAIIEDDPDSE